MKVYIYINIHIYIQVIKTLDNNTITIDNISVLTTVHDLKKMVEERWTLTVVNKQQLLFGDKDLGIYLYTYT
jgi:hypothetical protein